MSDEFLKASLYRICGEWVWHRKGKSLARDNIAIMMLHGVHDRQMASSARPPSNSMALWDFAAGLDSLLKRYSVISLDDAVAMWKGRKTWRPRCVVLTFDDSLACLLPTVGKLLSERGLCATFYISTEVIDAGKTYWWKRLENAVLGARGISAEICIPSGKCISVNPHLGLAGIADLKSELKLLPRDDIEKVVHDVGRQLFNGSAEVLEDPYSAILSWDGVRELAALGMTIGSHTVTHPNLALLPREVALAELSDSKRRIEEKSGQECRHVCYPYGANTPETREIAREAGYASAVTTEAPGWNCANPDLFGLRRFSMPAEPWRVRPMLSGFAGFRGTGIKIPKSSSVHRPLA